jgi:hypothetical protein
MFAIASSFSPSLKNSTSREQGTGDGEERTVPHLIAQDDSLTISSSAAMPKWSEGYSLGSLGAGAVRISWQSRTRKCWLINM